MLINISSIQKDNAEKEATQAEDKLATTLYTLQVYFIFTYYKKKDENLESRFILDFYKGEWWFSTSQA